MPTSGQRTGRDQPSSIAGYEILAKLGQGAMGAVFKARQKSLDRIVALKILPPKIAADKQFIERFQREARASAILNHPHIVQGIDVGQDPDSGLWYFAMEFVDGQSLDGILRKEKLIDEVRALEISRDVARALECAERHNVVHRDIKPDNILLSKLGEVKLADLGLAKKTNTSEGDAGLTQTGSAVGTPHYMSPEQIRGELNDLDTRTDIYALGATIFHMLTGRTPFQGDNSAVIMTRALTEPLPLAHRINPQVSEPASRLVAKMMAKERNKRVSNAQELVAQFDKLLERPLGSGPRTGIRSSIGPARGTRRGDTTGPKLPIRGETTVNASPIGGAARPLRGARNTSPALFVLPVLAVLVLGGAYFALSGGPEPSVNRASKKRAPVPTPTTVVKAAPDQPIEETPDAPPIEPEALTDDAKAAQALDLVKKFDGLTSGNLKGRVDRLDGFLKAHAGTPAAAEAAQLREQFLAEIKKMSAPTEPATPPKPTPPVQLSAKPVPAVKPAPKTNPEPAAQKPAQGDEPPALQYMRIKDVLAELEPLLSKNRFDDAVLLLRKARIATKDLQTAALLQQELDDVTTLQKWREEAVNALRKRGGEKISLRQGRLTVDGTLKKKQDRPGVSVTVKDGPEFTIGSSQLHVEDVAAHAPGAAKKSPESLRTLGLLFLNAGDLDNAQAHLLKAQKAGAGKRVALPLYRIKVVELGEAEARAEVVFHQAEELFNGKKLKEALGAYEAFRAAHGATAFAASQKEAIAQRIETIMLNFKPKITYRADKSMQMYRDGHRSGEFPVMEKADPLGPFSNKPAYWDQRTGKTVEYEVQSMAPLSKLRWKGAAMQRMTIEIEDLQGRMIKIGGPHQGGNHWAEFHLEFPPQKHFILRFRNHVSHWYFINEIELK